MPKAIPRLNLTAMLALAALLDLLLFRLASLVFLPNKSQGLPHLVSELGLFMSNLGGILGLLLTAVVLVRALRGDSILPRSMRITVSTIGMFFIILSAASILTLPVPDRFTSYLRISHAFLAAFVAIGLWHRNCPVRLKLVLTLFAIPIVLQTATMFCERMGWAPRFAVQGVRLAQASAFSALLLSPLLVPPRPRRGLQTGVIFAGGLIVFALLMFAVTHRFALAQVVALYGLRFDLPSLANSASKSYATMVALAYASVIVSTVASLAGNATSRLIGYGLILLVTSGHQIATTNHALFSLCGLCALALGAVHLEGKAKAQIPSGSPVSPRL